MTLGGIASKPGNESTPEVKVIKCINPATLASIGEVMATPPAAMGEILQHARDSQAKWQDTPLKNRIKLLKKVIQYINQHAEELASTIANETGKPKIEAINSDLISGIGVAAYAINNVGKALKPYRIRDSLMAMMSLLGRKSYIIPKPIGVVGIISPWNYPWGIPFGQAFMAIASGNAVIIKPSSETPMTGLKIQEVFDKVGFPKGLLRVIPGGGSAIGNALVESGVDRIIFTGSTEIGKQIMARAAQRLTPVTMELGGKDAMIVCNDANLDRAAAAGTWGAFVNLGQTCVGVKRIYAQKGIYDNFLAKFTEKVKNLKQGWGWDDPDVCVGSLINQHALEEMEKHVARAVEQGAQVVTGGHRNPNLPGLFFEPTVLANVTQDMDCARKEIFGPIVCVLPFNTPDDAVRLANDSNYALAGSVWTKDLKNGKTLAQRLDSGTILVNNLIYTYGLGATPWGGKRDSGFGRTHGKFGFDEVIEPHHVHIDSGSFLLAQDPWWHPYNARKFKANMAMLGLVAGKLRKVVPFFLNLLGSEENPKKKGTK